MNPAPDAEIASVGEYNHRWIVDNMTEFILRRLEAGFDTPEYRWSAMLNPPATNRAADVKSGATVKKKTTTAKKVSSKKAGE
jgi:hypothetical protein